MAINPPTQYGVRIRITPDVSGDNLIKADVALYRSDTPGGDKTLLAAQRGIAVWYYDDVRPVSSGTKYYYARTEYVGYTSSSYIGPVDAKPVDLSIEM